MSSKKRKKSKAQKRPDKRVAYELETPDSSRIIEDVDELTEEVMRGLFPDSPHNASYRDKEYKLDDGRAFIVIQEVVPGDDPDKRREATMEEVAGDRDGGEGERPPGHGGGGNGGRNPYYDVAVSFAGEQREYVEETVRHLQDEGIVVFYDKDEQARLWGMNLLDELVSTYRERAFRTLMFVSDAYAEKVWPTQERRAAQDRAIHAMNEPYILPVLMEDTTIPGLHSTTGRMDGRTLSPEKLAHLVVEHLREHGRDVGPPPLQRNMAQRVGVRVEPLKQNDGRWEVVYRIHNGGDYPIHTALLSVDDPGQEGRPEDQMGTALEIVIGNINAGEALEDRSPIKFTREPNFGELTYMAALLFTDHWGNHWATTGGEVTTRRYPARVC